MNNPKIVITKQDGIDQLVDPVGEGVLYLEPTGIHQINEVSDFITHKDDKVKYHIHDHGYELFVMTKGSVEAILGGKRCVANVGDMMLIKPYTPHAFRYREDGTVWQELIQQLSLFENERSIARILINCPDKLDDPEFMRLYQSRDGRIDYPEIPVMDTDLVNPAELPGFMCKEDYYKQFCIPGITWTLKYPRWELDGIKEIWEFIIDEGVTVNWGEHYHDSELFVVRQGSVKVEAQGFEPLTAYAEDIIHIPNYTAHRITSLESGTVLHDYNCRHNLLLLLEELSINKRINPDIVTDDYLEDLLLRYDCPITEIRCAGNGFSFHMN